MNSASTNAEDFSQVSGAVDKPLQAEFGRDGSGVAGLLAARRTSAKFSFQTAVLLCVLATVFFLWSEPWRAFEYGGDEGMEFSKMQLLLQHPDMAKLAWNDQSWFYSQVFAVIFAVTGFECGIPRLVTFGIVACLLFVFPRLMPRNTRWPHLIFAWLFFWCWPQMPYLAVSAMLEMPAIGLAVIAAALTPRDQMEWRYWRFVCAGILFGLAVQVKLTALIIVPALTVKMACVWWREIRCRQVPQTLEHCAGKNCWWLPPALGCGVFAIVYVTIAWWSPDWDWSRLWGSHMLAASTRAAAVYRLEPQYLLQSPGTLVAAFLGIIMLWRKRYLHEAIFPLVLLVTVTIVFFNHRPWWYYYGIHFAIPLTLLGGWGAVEMLGVGFQARASLPVAAKPAFNPEVSMMLGALAVSLWAGFECSRGYGDALFVRQAQPTADIDAIKELEKYKGRIKWAFTQDNIFAAQAGYVIPPELTITAKKRYWEGKINDKMILNTIKRYRCEVLILDLSRELEKKAWNQFLKNEYVKTWSEGDKCIFVAKRLNPAPEPNGGDFLKQLGI